MASCPWKRCIACLALYNAMFAGPQMKALSSRMSQVNGFAITVCFVTLLVPLKWENSICPIPLPAGSTGDFVWFLQVRYRGGSANKLYRRFDLSIGQVRPELVWLLRDLFALPNYVVLASNDARCMYIGISPYCSIRICRSNPDAMSITLYST